MQHGLELRSCQLIAGLEKHLGNRFGQFPFEQIICHGEISPCDGIRLGQTQFFAHSWVGDINGLDQKIAPIFFTAQDTLVVQKGQGVVDGGARYLQLVCQPLRWQMVTDGQTFLTDQVEQAGRNVFVWTHKSSILHGKQGQVHVRRVLVRQNAPEGFAAR